jgi:hypothetical protein
MENIQTKYLQKIPNLMKQKIILSLFFVSTFSVFLFSLLSYLSVENPNQNVLYTLNNKIPSGVIHSFLGSLPFFQPYPSKKQITQQTQTISQPPLEDVTSAENALVIGKDLKLNNVQIQGGLVTEGVGQFNSGIVTNGSNIDVGNGAIKASNIIYGLVQGTGISVGTGQSPLITNTGVLSLQNQAGVLSLTAGSGIGINGLTISNNDAGSSQNIFKNIDVSGQSTITAGTNNDALTFVSGSGISLTTDSTNKLLTITNTNNSSTGGGWTEGSGIISETNPFDYVGIGTTNPSAPLDIEENIGGVASIVNQNGTGDLFTASQAGTTKFRIDNSGNVNVVSGNVGIGTASTAQTPLQVNGIINSYNGGAFQVSDSSLASAANYAAKFTYDSSLLGLSNDFRIRLGGALTSSGFGISDYDNAMRFWVSRTGNVGIGTTTPTALLDVAGTASISGQLALYGTPTIQSTAKQTLVLGGSTTGDMQFKPGNSSSSLYLTSGGNVGIGTTSPQTPLQVNGLINSYGNAGFLVSDGSSGLSSNYTAKLTYDSSLLGLSNDFRITHHSHKWPARFHFFSGEKDCMVRIAQRR